MKTKLSKATLDDIQHAKQALRKSDDWRWIVAELAYNVVGRREEGATKIMAEQLNYKSPSSIEQLAKAWNLRICLEAVNKTVPLDNLYIGHYVAVGKALSAGTITLKEADKLLNEANKIYDGKAKPVEWIRSRLAGKMGDDDWRESLYKEIANIKNHIINAPYTGVHPEVASLVAWFGRAFVKFGEKALELDNSNQLERLQYMREKMREIMDEFEIEDV